jgi:hypothetical protein
VLLDGHCERDYVHPPPDRLIDGANPRPMFAPAPYDERYSPNWWKAGERERERRAEQESQELQHSIAEREKDYGRSPAAE